MKGEPVEVLSERLHQLLEGKVVRLARMGEREVMIEFTDGGRLFVDLLKDGTLDVSVT